MSTYSGKLGRHWWVAAMVVAAMFVPAAVIGQDEVEGEVPAAAAAEDVVDEVVQPADEAAEPPAADAGPDEPVAEQAPASDTVPQVGEQPADAPAEVPDGPPADPAVAAGEAADAAADAVTGTSPLVLAAIILALFILPVLIGNFLAKQLKMPDHGWKISVVLGTLAAALLVIGMGEFKFGPDLAGGITLVYEVADPTAIAAEGDDPAADRERRVDMNQLIDALKKRIDPTGTREVTIREYGPAIEIIIPRTGQDELEYVKRRITELGQLEFRITADPTRTSDRPIIDQARTVPPSQKDVMLGGNKVAEWIAYDEAEFGPVDVDDERIVKRMAGDTPEALVLIDAMNVTGDYLSSVSKGVDERGGPAVNFSFDRIGAQRFRMLTSANVPDSVTGAVRYLGIILDKRLLSAPSIRTTISDRGQISGGTMTEQEVDHTISVLNAGSLPAALNKEPISEAIISPTLGAVTVEKGKTAIVASLLGVMVFMLVYYQFAGIVACLVLTFNLILVLAVMVLIQAAFTLPGLAGLVLTIGMSVDANVLIYERIREELRGGAALRMAIRNGFGRAMSAIIDSNLTTIIAGVALYAVATDQVKGFAVTLIIGILTSMYTALFVARLVFDIAERRGLIKSLRMLQFLSQPNIDFLRARYVAGGLSAMVILIGMAAVFGRGTEMLDIDFTGGSSVTFILRQDSRMSIAEVRDAMHKTEMAERNLLVVERGEDSTRYSVDTNEESVDDVKRVLIEHLGGRLLANSIEIDEVRAFEEEGFPVTEATVRINQSDAYDPDDGVSHDALMEQLRRALAAVGEPGIQPSLSNPDYRRGSAGRHKEWNVRLGGLDESTARSALDRLEADMEAMPLFPLANKIGGRVSADMQFKAMYAIFLSLLGMVAYLWLRFQRVTYGLAAAIAVAHDVAVTIGLLALSSYVVDFIPPLASMLQLSAFQVNLTIVAAVLTIMGYSLNDTIVTFDRLREVKGKSPNLTPEMVNRSVNLTLSRTILTAVTTLIAVGILYFFGGDGIHGFAFCFMIGTIVGTYSTIYIAAPVLLWLSGTPAAPTPAAVGDSAAA